MDDLDYRAIRKRVEERMEQRTKFFKDIASYITTNIICWGIWFFFTGGREGGGFPWPLFVTFFWGLGLINDAVQLFFRDNNFLENMREREFQREVERERERLYREGYSDAKPKRGEVALSEDGELIYEDEPSDRRRDVSSLN
jgi:hypothetical protein